jgi:hypothetical protein
MESGWKNEYRSPIVAARARASSGRRGCTSVVVGDREREKSVRRDASKGKSLAIISRQRSSTVRSGTEGRQTLGATRGAGPASQMHRRVCS